MKHSCRPTRVPGKKQNLWSPKDIFGNPHLETLQESSGRLGTQLKPLSRPASLHIASPCSDLGQRLFSYACPERHLRESLMRARGMLWSWAFLGHPPAGGILTSKRFPAPRPPLCHRPADNCGHTN